MGDVHDPYDTCLRDWVTPTYASEKDGYNCLDVKVTSSCGNNFEKYVHDWADLRNSSNTSSPGSPQRPTILAHLDGNTSVITSWLDQGDSQRRSHRFGRTSELNLLLEV